MEKNLLDKFIQKYHLNGLAEQVVWTAEKSKLTTRAASDDKNVVITVSVKSDDIDDGQYGIMDTSKLKSLLGVLDDEITVKTVKRADGLASGFEFKDTGTKVTAILGDLTTIPKVPNLKSIPDFELEFDLDEAFITKFVKSKSALPDVDTVTFICDNKKIDIVLGYAKINTDRISMSVKGAVMEKVEPISFKAEYLKNILVANKESVGKMKISSEGLASVEFEAAPFTSQYYLVELEVSD